MIPHQASPGEVKQLSTHREHLQMKHEHKSHSQHTHSCPQRLSSAAAGWFGWFPIVAISAAAGWLG